MAGSSAYTKSQIIEYFDRIRFPEEWRFFDLDRVDARTAGFYLNRLVEQHLVSVPFENLTLHYSQHRIINTDPRHVFNKIVCQPGRGGYCMENNTLLHHVLLGLGFNVYMAGARVYDAIKGRYDGFQHCVNIVTIDGEGSFVDVGFGARGPLSPFVMSPGAWDHIKPARTRLRHDSIPQTRNHKQKYWIHEYQKDENADWVPQYCFSETEFLPQDFEVMNYMTSTNPESIFVQRVMCVRFTRMDQSAWDQRQAGQIDVPSQGENERDSRIKGAFIVDADSFKWRTEGGKPVMEQNFGSDAERVAVLATYFGIDLDEADAQAIKGTATEVPNQNLSQ